MNVFNSCLTLLLWCSSEVASPAHQGSQELHSGRGQVVPKAQPWAFLLIIITSNPRRTFPITSGSFAAGWGPSGHIPSPAEGRGGQGGLGDAVARHKPLPSAQHCQALSVLGTGSVLGTVSVLGTGSVQALPDLPALSAIPSSLPGTLPTTTSFSSLRMSCFYFSWLNSIPLDEVMPTLDDLISLPPPQLFKIQLFSLAQGVHLSDISA